MLTFALALMAAATQAASDPSAKLLESCDAHKFETIIEATVDGQPKRSRLRLCGTEGQTDADWVKTLKDAVAKTEGNQQMPKAVRDQVANALNAEIVRLTLSGSAITKLPPPRATTKTPTLDGIAALPPLPGPKTAEPTAALPPPRMLPPRSSTPEYASLPPLPTTVTAPTRILAGGSLLLPALPKPKMRFICYTPGDVGDIPCAEFARDTLLTVRADEDLPSGTSLRFVRNGDARADVELAQLRKGKTQRFALPPEVCRHVSGATLEIRIVRAVRAAGPSGQEVGKEGPYNLRC